MNGDFTIFCLESFILRHQSTLRHLSLSDCYVDVSCDFYPWAQIFQSFEEKLTELRSFQFQINDKNGYVIMSDNETRDCYMEVDESEFPEDSPEDQIIELDSLQKSIENRNV